MRRQGDALGQRCHVQGAGSELIRLHASVFDTLVQEKLALTVGDRRLDKAPHWDSLIAPHLVQAE